MELADEARKARREYMKQWRAANPDKVCEYNRKYWERKATEKASERRKSEDSGSGGEQ